MGMKDSTMKAKLWSELCLWSPALWIESSMKVRPRGNRSSLPMVVSWQACWNRNTVTEKYKYKYKHKSESVKPRYVFCPWQPAGKLVALQGGGGCRAESTGKYFIGSHDIKSACTMILWSSMLCSVLIQPSSLSSQSTSSAYNELKQLINDLTSIAHFARPPWANVEQFWKTRELLTFLIVQITSIHQGI